MKHLALLVLLFIGLKNHAQLKPAEKDSLWNIWQSTVNADSLRFSALYIYAQKGFLGSKPDSAYQLGSLHYREASRLGNEKEKGLAQLTRGISWAIRGEFDSCKYYFEDALKIHDAIGYESGTMRSSFNLGNLYRMSGDTVKALELYDKSYSSTLALKDSMGLIKNLSIQGRMLRESGKFESALLKFTEAYNISDKIKEIDEMSATLTDRAHCYKRLSDYTNAIKDYEKSIDIARTYNLPTRESNALGQIAILLNRINEFSKAKKLASRAVIIADSTQNSDLLFNSLGILIDTKKIDKDTTGIGQLIDRMLEISDKSQVADKQIEARILRLETYYAEKKYNDVLRLAEETDSILNAKQLHRSFFLYQKLLSKTHLKLGNQKLALSFAKKGLEAAEHSQVTSELLDAHEYLHQIYETRGNKELSLFHLKQAYKYSDDVYTSENKSTVLNSAFAYEYKNQAYEDSLEFSLEKRILEDKNEAQRKTNLAILLGLGVVSFLALFLFRSRKTIATQKEEISKSLDEKDTLLREIHHRVKNNLQVVSSLLRLQTRATDDEGAKGALNESQSRVESMSLIHQNLYQKENLTGIKMKDYLEKLTTNLFNTYRVDNDQISLQMEIEDLNLDVDTVVPLGLIINELVTNALKYAFPQGRRGELKVKLNQENNLLKLSVSDNGIGMSDSKLASSSDSFGYKLINSFKKKLKAELDINSALNEGTDIILRIRNFQAV